MDTSQARRNLISRQSGEHLHDFAQVLFGWRGRMDCEFRRNAGRLSSGTAALVPAGEAHRYAGLSEDSELMVIDVSMNDPLIQSLEQACCIDFGVTLFNQPEFLMLDPDTLPLLDFAASQLEASGRPVSPMIRCQLVSLFLTRLCELYSEGASRALRGTRLDLARLNQLIEGNLATPPTNAELAAAMHLSESHFYTLFQCQFGMSPQHYVMKRRLLKARAMLTGTRLSLSSLAGALGFSDASSLSRAYKRYFNETPGTTRRAIRKN